MPFGLASGRRIRFREVQLEKKKEDGASNAFQTFGYADESRDPNNTMLSGTSTFQLSNYAPETSARGGRGKGKRASRSKKK